METRPTDIDVSRWLTGAERTDNGVRLWIECVEHKTRPELIQVIWEMMDEIDRLKVAAGETAPSVAV